MKMYLLWCVLKPSFKPCQAVIYAPNPQEAWGHFMDDLLIPPGKEEQCIEAKGGFDVTLDGALTLSEDDLHDNRN